MAASFACQCSVEVLLCLMLLLLQVRVAVITDGERILGLGDLGAHGMGIPTGKCVVYGAAGAKPDWLLPITVDVGTNNKQLQGDPLYVGLPQRRVRGQPYTDLMLELVLGLQERFGRRVLVHWEDLAAKNAFQILQVRCHVCQLQRHDCSWLPW